MKGQDELVKKRVEAKNALENFTYNIKNTIRDEKYKDKFEGSDKETLEKAVDETVKWLESNPEA